MFTNVIPVFYSTMYCSFPNLRWVFPFLAHSSRVSLRPPVLPLPLSFPFQILCTYSVVVRELSLVILDCPTPFTDLDSSAVLRFERSSCRVPLLPHGEKVTQGHVTSAVPLLLSHVSLLVPLSPFVWSADEAFSSPMERELSLFASLFFLQSGVEVPPLFIFPLSIVRRLSTKNPDACSFPPKLHVIKNGFPFPAPPLPLLDHTYDVCDSPDSDRISLPPLLLLSLFSSGWSSPRWNLTSPANLRLFTLSFSRQPPTTQPFLPLPHLAAFPPFPTLTVPSHDFFSFPHPPSPNTLLGLRFWKIRSFGFFFRGAPFGSFHGYGLPSVPPSPKKSRLIGKAPLPSTAHNPLLNLAPPLPPP